MHPSLRSLLHAFHASADVNFLSSIIFRLFNLMCLVCVAQLLCMIYVVIVGCENSLVDLVFVLDSSGSIRDSNPADGSYDNWSLLLQFVVNVINRLSVGPTATQVGVVKFANIGENEFYLNTYDNKQSIIDRVQTISYVGANTNTSGGLYIMRTQQFTQANGDRPNVQNIGIVVTDGESTFDKEKTVPEAEAARAQGIRVYSVGITSAVNEVELRSMASMPQELDKQYWTSSDFQVLNGIVDTLVAETCATPTPTPAPTTPAPAGNAACIAHEAVTWFLYIVVQGAQLYLLCLFNVTKFIKIVVYYGKAFLNNSILFHSKGKAS